METKTTDQALTDLVVATRDSIHALAYSIAGGADAAESDLDSAVELVKSRLLVALAEFV